jgi:hypothetical protein
LPKGEKMFQPEEKAPITPGRKLPQKETMPEEKYRNYLI